MGKGFADGIPCAAAESATHGDREDGAQLFGGSAGRWPAGERIHPGSGGEFGVGMRAPTKSTVLVGTVGSRLRFSGMDGGPHRRGRPYRKDGGVEIRRAAEQFVTERDDITTLHCLSFGDHYDPARVAVGPLVALNDERVGPGAGYSTHPHRDVDILTWVVDGTLRHESSLGVAATIRSGTTQRLTAGTGVTHSETNGSDDGAVAVPPAVVRDREGGRAVVRVVDGARS